MCTHNAHLYTAAGQAFPAHPYLSSPYVQQEVKRPPQQVCPQSLPPRASLSITPCPPHPQEPPSRQHQIQRLLSLQQQHSELLRELQSHATEGYYEFDTLSMPALPTPQPAPPHPLLSNQVSGRAHFFSFFMDIRIALSRMCLTCSQIPANPIPRSQTSLTSLSSSPPAKTPPHITDTLSSNTSGGTPARTMFSIGSASSSPLASDTTLFDSLAAAKVSTYQDFMLALGPALTHSPASQPPTPLSAFGPAPAIRPNSSFHSLPPLSHPSPPLPSPMSSASALAAHLQQVR